MISIRWIESPIGWLELHSSNEHLTALYFRDEAGTDSGPDSPVLARTKQQLAEYFARERTVFELPLQPVGTDFQLKVWAALHTVPFGKTASYLDIAKALGDPNATRAVGAANGKNPISLIVPCHRVIGSNGSLTGYGGGMERKRWLLEFENPSRQSRLFA